VRYLLKKILVFVGTRPEAIKMAPVFFELKRRAEFNPLLVSTGQHKEMLSQALSDFGLTPDIDLNVMTTNQTLSGVSAKLFESIDKLLESENPDAILVQGDTTTVQVASLASFYRGIPIGHVEAGLRSHNMHAPFPEELNRRVTALVADWHFAPTNLSKENLLSEKIQDSRILVSGNTVIDALFWMTKKMEIQPPKLPIDIEKSIAEGKRIILVTGHRRESFGQGFENICTALELIAKNFPNDQIIYPVHLNPKVRTIVNGRLKDHENITLADPLPYESFVFLMNKSYIILSDSGGIQEEAPSLGKPVLVMRTVTERPEGVDAGVNFLVGTDPQAIFNLASEFLRDDKKYHAISSIESPFGDGKAAQKICDFLQKQLL